MSALLTKKNEKELKKLFQDFLKWIITLHEDDTASVNISIESTEEIKSKFNEKASKVIKSIFQSRKAMNI